MPCCAQRKGYTVKIKKLFKNKRRTACFIFPTAMLVLVLGALLCWHIFIYIPTRHTGPEDVKFPFPLPDYTANYSDNYLRYDDLSPRIVRKYINKLQREGFTYCQSTYRQLLYREDVLIILSDDTAPEQEFILNNRDSLSMEYYLLTPPPEDIYTDGAALSEVMRDGSAVAYVDHTPEGLYEATGMRVAVVAKLEEPARYTQHAFSVYLVGPEGAMELPYSTYYFEKDSFVWADVDSDGENEVVIGGQGNTSRPSVELYAYGLEDGCPVLETEFFSMTSGGRPKLALEDGLVYLVYDLFVGYENEKPVYSTHRIKLEIRDGCFYNTDYITDGDLVFPE